jgi:hypothetical protein
MEQNHQQKKNNNINNPIGQVIRSTDIEMTVQTSDVKFHTNYNKTIFISGVVRLLLSMKPVIALSRLSYCAFVSHAAMQLFSVATMRNPAYVSILTLVSSKLSFLSHRHKIIALL